MWFPYMEKMVSPVLGLYNISLTLTNESYMSIREMLYKFIARAYEISPNGVLKYNLMDNIKYVNILLYILILGVLNHFQLDNMMCF